LGKFPKPRFKKGSFHEVWFSKTIAKETDCSTYIREASDSASLGTQGTQRLGVAYKPQKGRIQPGLQQSDTRLSGDRTRCIRFGNRTRGVANRLAQSLAVRTPENRQAPV